jgi:hypothetical protein
MSAMHSRRWLLAAIVGLAGMLLAAPAQAAPPALAVLQQVDAPPASSAPGIWSMAVEAGDRVSVEVQDIGTVPLDVCLLDPYWYPDAPAGAACTGGEGHVDPHGALTLPLKPLVGGQFQIVVRRADCADPAGCSDPLGYAVEWRRFVDSPDRGAIVAVGDSFLAGAARPRSGSACRRGTETYARGFANVNLACAGTTVSSFLHPAAGQVDQLASLRRVASKRTVSAVLVSLGGDDADVAQVIDACEHDTSVKATACIAALGAATARIDGARRSIGPAVHAIRIAAHTHQVWIAPYPLVLSVAAGQRVCPVAAASPAVAAFDKALTALEATAHEAGAIVAPELPDLGSGCDGRVAVDRAFLPAAGLGAKTGGGWLVAKAERQQVALSVREQMGLAAPSIGAGAWSNIEEWDLQHQSMEIEVRRGVGPGSGPGQLEASLVTTQPDGTTCATALTPLRQLPSESDYAVAADDPCGFAGARLSIRVVTGRNDLDLTLVSAAGAIIVDGRDTIRSIIVI